jgi:hypothetical protein
LTVIVPVPGAPPLVVFGQLEPGWFVHEIPLAVGVKSCHVFAASVAYWTYAWIG